MAVQGAPPPVRAQPPAAPMLPRMEYPRLIPLRRPPQLSVMEGRFVPEGVSLDAVDAAWERLRARLPHAFDGPVLHVVSTHRNGHGGVVAHCVESSYRFHAVAHEGVETGIRPLGVKGICHAPDGRILMARRGKGTLNHAGQWEFAPGGTVEPGVPPVQQLLRELQEETGWRARSAPVVRGLIFDPHARSWEVVYSLEVLPPEVPVEGWECSALSLVEPPAWPQPLAPVAEQMLPLVRSVARAR